MAELPETALLYEAPESALLRRARELDVLAGESTSPTFYRYALAQLIEAVAGVADLDLTQEEAEQVDREARSYAGDIRYHQMREG